MYKTVIDQPTAAKKAMVDYTEPGVKISAYEWALYRMGYTSSSTVSGYQIVNTIDVSGRVVTAPSAAGPSTSAPTKVDSSILYFKKLVDEYPDTKFGKTPFSRLASYYASRGDTAEANPFFDNVMKKYPDDIIMLRNYVSYCLRTKSNIEKGLETAIKIMSVIGSLSDIVNIERQYDQLLEVNGDSTGINGIYYGTNFATELALEFREPLTNYIRYWMEKGRNEEGVNDAITMLLNVDKTGGRQAVARIFISAGKPEKALIYYGPEYVSQIKDKPADLLAYAQFWTGQKKNTESALSALTLYNRLRTRDRAMLSSLENVYNGLGKSEEATKYGAEYVEANKDNTTLLYSYAMRATTTTPTVNLDNALKAATYAVEKEPNKYQYWDVLSRVYEKMKNYQKALETGEKALSLATTDAIKNSIKTRIDTIKKEMEKKG